MTRRDPDDGAGVVAALWLVGTAIGAAARGGAVAARPRPADPAPAPKRRGNPAAGILSARTAARRLGIGRDTLARLVEAATLASVPKGSRQGFRAADVEELIQRGFSLPDAPPRRARPTKRKRRRAPESADAASIAAELAKF